ncbi:hypothetical protein MUP01_09440 [Candidatus Bathyarchaeota archaeon]|nr:hypothetical protein [Candidatus Bathyarchaeota archaeon]
MIDKEEKDAEHEAKEVKEILGVVSAEVPKLIRSLLESVFSEEAGKNMGKAAAAYYKELKNGGLPEAVAVKLTEDYMHTFTSLGDMLRNVGKGKGSGADIGEKIANAFEKKHNRDEEDE